MFDRVSQNDDLRLELLSRRLRAVTLGAPQAVFASFASALALVLVFHDIALQPLVLGWFAAIVVLQLLRLALVRSTDLGSTDDRYLKRRLILVGGVVSLVSLLWGAGVPLFAWMGPAWALPALAGIGAATFAGVLLIHRAIPLAAYLHIAALGAGLAAAVILVTGANGWPLLGLLAIYAVTLWASIARLDRLFVNGIAAELERSEAADTVAMLLHDYEQQSSDWLWSTDSAGHMIDVAPRLAAAFGTNLECLEGQPFCAMFDDAEEAKRLGECIAQQLPFRELVVRLSVDGDMRYWQLAARPREDGRLSGVARDVTSARQADERIAFMAHFDNLTGLANRHQFNERLEDALRVSAARRGHLALYYLDLDDFKAINDTRGHLVGDRVLRAIAERLGAQVRSEDLVARLGGDEFAILIEMRAGMGMLIERAHRFLSAIRAPLEVDGQTYRVSTSIGVARCSDGECDAQELLRRADLALFAAKRKGRDTLALFEPALDREARERQELESDLREALSREELRLHYQPIIDLDSGTTTGYEALLRWYHPRRGLIPPADFLPIAEQTGLIVPIGEFVIHQALAEIAAWPGDFRIAINLSPTQVFNPQLVSQVAQALHTTGIAAGRVEFEITEHVLMKEGEDMPEALVRLREMGARIALDDFGTGFSSLSYLRRFPFDRLKIDRKFVEHIAEDSDSQAIVSSITRLADALGMDTTAEGIETRKQLDLLRKLGCQEAQGFLICEPAPAEAFASPEAAEAALSDHGPDVVDYRKAREAVLRRRDDRVA